MAFTFLKLGMTPALAVLILMVAHAWIGASNTAGWGVGGQNAYPAQLEACPEAATGGSCSYDLASIRRACWALAVDRSTYHYRSRRAGQAPLIERIKAIAATRVSYGYRHI
jgi:hypothetical protein